MVVLHCTTIFHVLLQFQQLGWGWFYTARQISYLFMLQIFRSWGDGGVTLQDLFHDFVTVSAAGVMVVLHCKTKSVFNVTFSAAGVRVVINYKTYFMILLQFQQLGWWWCYTARQKSVFNVTVSAAGVMMVLHCKTYFMFYVTVSAAGVMGVLHYAKPCRICCYGCWK